MSKAYLITWNPRKWDFDDGYASFLRDVQDGRMPVIAWAVSNSSIEKGDTMFLMRLGDEPRGIIAKGIAIDDVHFDKHFDFDLAKSGAISKQVRVRFVSAGDYEKGEYIDWKELKRSFPEQNWTPQSSGISIKNEYYSNLDSFWSAIEERHLQVDGINIPLKPKNRVRKADGSIRYICGRCNTSFSEAVRCPECGQLQKGIEKYDAE